MKKILLSLFVSILMLGQCFAHGEVQVRPRCYGSIIPWQYKAIARVNHWANINYGSNFNCYGAEAKESNHCAWQKAACSNNVATLNGDVFTHRFHCGRGYATSPLMQLILPPDSLTDHVDTSDVDSSGKVESSHLSITLLPDVPGLTSSTILVNGFMQVNTKDVFTEFEILVWDPNHVLNDDGTETEDLSIDPDEILWRAYAKIINGALVVEDNFANDGLTLDNPEILGYDTEMYRLSFKNFRKNLSWSPDIPLDDVTFVFRSHAQGNDNARISQVIEKTDLSKDVTFNVFPNPATTSFNIKYQAETEGNAEITIFNELGEVVGTPVSKYLEKGAEYDLQIDPKEYGMVNGIYYVSLKIGEETYLRKVIITGR